MPSAITIVTDRGAPRHKMMIDTIAPRRLALLEDEALTLDYDAGSSTQAQEWIPLHATSVTRMGRAHIRVVRSDPDTYDTAPSGGTAIQLGAVTGVLAGEGAVLDDPSGMRVTIDFAQLRALVRAPSDRSDVRSALTLSSALLINRLGGALLHAASAADPSGHAWIIAGDIHSGKTTTCAALVDAGWRFLADDEVVVRRSPADVLQIEGWPRVVHLDESRDSAQPAGVQTPREVRARWSGQWLRSAPLGGVILPAIQRQRATDMQRITPSDALAAIMRQSPWLTADREIAEAVLSLLSEAARTRCYVLTLGRDAHGRPGVVQAVVESTLEKA
jgi:hypothetical protein